MVACNNELMDAALLDKRESGQGRWTRKRIRDGQAVGDVVIVLQGDAKLPKLLVQHPPRGFAGRLHGR